MNLKLVDRPIDRPRLDKALMKSHLSPDTLAGLPDTSGVYLFYGPLGELLYVGKSKSVRSRVRSHFSAPEERWLYRKIHRVEVRETAGELGALLLESQLIKELRPMFNVASRRRRRIIIARRLTNSGGYFVVRLEPVDYLDVKQAEPVLGVFKHKTQAKEFLATIAKSHRLCPKLLRLETARRHCFSYHLGQCDGACMGEEDPEQYNVRLESAFESRRIKAWPYDGGVVVEERSVRGSHQEVFLIDNWCLVGTFGSVSGSIEKSSQEQRRFDYDSYKILYAYITDPRNQQAITALARQEFDKLCINGFQGATSILARTGEPQGHT
jgi:DNA polymerase-3 subunit epsilon